MLQTARFLCSVAAVLARLLSELRKVLIRASAFSRFIASLPTSAAAASPSTGVISAMTLALRRKMPAAGPAASVVAIHEQLVVVAPPPAAVVGADLSNVAGSCGHDVAEQQAESKKKTTAWAATARRRPSRLVIPVADVDAGKVAAGWAAAAAAAKEADVEVEGEGFWLASRAGPRHAMEDAYAVVTDKHDGDSDLAFYGVFDGHGGRAAVDFVSERLGRNVVSAVLAAGTEMHGEAGSSAAEEDGVSAAIRAAYLDTDNQLLAQHKGESGGACATTAVVKGGHLYVAHVGDCRAVLSRNGAADALTADHTCAREDERARIERQGGYVRRGGSGVWRVQGSLAVSRAFGDGALKRWVVAEPAVTAVALADDCEFLVIASDGLWDKVSNQEAVDAVSRSRATACRELVDMARRRGSRDDVTVMVVDLGSFVR